MRLRLFMSDYSQIRTNDTVSVHARPLHSYPAKAEGGRP